MDKSRIMIVEDEIIIARDISRTLEGFGFEVVCIANNGEAAVLKAESHRPDLVLMDIMLKGKMDGIEAAGKIYSGFHIPVVYLTSYADDKILERAQKTGPFGYLVKPFDDQDLKITVMMACCKSAADKKVKVLAEELAKSNRDLKEALENVKVLSGFLPICAWCKKIRDDKGYWNQIEKYISEHSEMQFSHGICPECARKHEEE